MTSTNALAVDRSGTTITRKAPGVLLGLLTAAALFAAPAAALGAETTTTLNGYTATPSLTTTTTVATTTVATTSAVVTPNSGAKPESESKPTGSESTPKSSVKPSTASSSPTTETKATTLPFTGLNLAWVVGVGLLLLVAGLSLRVLQRRRAHR